MTGRPTQWLNRLAQSRIPGRLGILFSLTIIVIALIVLYRELSDLDISDTLAALRNTPPHHVVASAICVACGYFTLTFYDLFALRTLGRDDIGYRIAALAGFTSYAIGHNVGATIFSAGAVRYRVYSANGLDAIEVAKLCFIAGLTFWLGNAAVLGLGIAYHPEAASAIDLLPAAINRVLAIATLVLLAAYTIWVSLKDRTLGRGNWSVLLPGGRLTAVQIGIGFVDLTFCALAMYMLLPASPDVGFVTVAVVFVSATVLGFASHAPGGLGVFDAALLVGLWQYDKGQLLAALLLFRILYYLIPFILALGVLAIREVLIVARRRAGRRSRHDREPARREEAAGTRSANGQRSERREA